MRLRRGAAFLAAVAVQLVVLYAPAAPEAPTGGLRVDWLVHFAVFGAVVWTGRQAGLPGGWLVALAALHAPGSEAVQAWLLPDRSGNPSDVLADLVGVAAGAVVPLRRRVPLPQDQP
jgi:VanZ family protein